MNQSHNIRPVDTLETEKLPTSAFQSFGFRGSRKAKPLRVAISETDTKEAYINRFEKPKEPLVSGTSLEVKARPVVIRPNLHIGKDGKSDDDTEPSLTSELVRGIQSAKEPFFNDEIKGWDKNAEDDEAFKFITEISSASYQYLSYDHSSRNDESSSPPKPKKPSRKKTKKKAQPYTENEEEMESKSELVLDEKESDIEIEIEVKNQGLLPDLCEKQKIAAERSKIQEINIASVSVFDFATACVKKAPDSNPMYTRRADYPEYEKINYNTLNMRRKASSSALTMGNFDEIGIITGKKYYANLTEAKQSRCKDRAKTADVIRTTLPNTKTADVIRTSLPNISSHSFQDAPPALVGWGMIKSSKPRTASQSRTGTSNPHNSTNGDIPWLEASNQNGSPRVPMRRPPKKLSSHGFRTCKFYEVEGKKDKVYFEPADRMGGNR